MAKDFKFTRHCRVFDGFGDNRMELGKFLASIRAEQAKGTFYQLGKQKHFTKKDPHRHGQAIDCFSQVYYTRQPVDAKQEGTA